MKIIKVKHYDAMSETAAAYLLKVIKEEKACALGLATGSTPIGMYKVLVNETKAENLSWENVETYNLDEYMGLDASSHQSYAHYMAFHLFDHVNVPKENIHIPNGKAMDHQAECLAYEARIEATGGVDIQVLGIGRNGHIGFNEPNTFFEARTHVVDLDEKTIQDNARFFADVSEVPRKAISMGIKTILSAKQILLLASGKEKAEALYDMIHGPITPVLPASILQLHPNVVVICDEAAAEKLVAAHDVV